MPYEPGRSFVVGTGNCGGSHPRGEWDEYAYDFLMPIGTPVVAARDGDVIVVEERFANGTRTSGEGNGIRVRHADGTIAMYWHLTTNGALVEVGDRVKQGQIIGLSGESGDATAPHLHFCVSAPCPACSTTSLAVTFRNTRPHVHGLVAGESYLAK